MGEFNEALVDEIEKNMEGKDEWILPEEISNQIRLHERVELAMRGLMCHMKEYKAVSIFRRYNMFEKKIETHDDLPKKSDGELLAFLENGVITNELHGRTSRLLFGRGYKMEKKQ